MQSRRTRVFLSFFSYPSAISYDAFLLLHCFLPLIHVQMFTPPRKPSYSFIYLHWWALYLFISLRATDVAGSSMVILRSQRSQSSRFEQTQRNSVKIGWFQSKQHFLWIWLRLLTWSSALPLHRHNAYCQCIYIFKFHFILNGFSMWCAHSILWSPRNNIIQLLLFITSNFLTNH